MKRIAFAVALLLSLTGVANAESRTGQTPESKAIAKLAEPRLLANRPVPSDVPECEGILSQQIIDLVDVATIDPAETFEDARRAHPNMIMMPPPVECASKLWQSLQSVSLTASRATVPAGTEALSLRQYPTASLFNLEALSASVGTNIDLANGVEGYQGETNIAVDPNNPQHIVAFSNTFFKDTTAGCQSPTGGTASTYGTMALFGSTDGGANWTYNCAPWPATLTGGVTSAAYWFGSDPALAWDSQGRAYATYMLISQSAAGASGAAIVVARSSDNGASWQSLGTVVNGIASTTQGNDKEMMAIDNTSGQAFSHPGRIYVIWDAANAEKIAYSDDGAAWTTVNFPSNTGAIGGNVVVGTDGTVYVIWSRYNVENIVFSKSTDGGATWTTPAIIATLALQSFGSNNLPPAQDKRGINGFGALDIDHNPASPFFGSLYVAFDDFPAGVTTGADLNTYVIHSTNGGTSWSSRVKVNDDNFGATQIFPWLAVDQSDGTVNVSWYDSRLDPLNRKTQMVYARSSNGAVSFEPNVLVEDGGSAWRNNVNYNDENSADNAAFNGNQYGDYSGIAAANRQVHPLWTDSRMFFPTADTHSPTRAEDNATSLIVNCSAPSVLSAPTVNPSTAPSVVVSWTAPAAWGTNATGGTYSVYRNTTNTFPGGSPLVSGLTATSYADTTGVPATSYFYFVRARNNCPGTVLTPMNSDSPGSASVVYGSSGTPIGTLQGTITAAGDPVNGATVTAGTFSATTDASGFYQFAAIDAGTYTVSASATGYTGASASGVVVSGNATTVQNLSLTPLSSSSCFTDTTYSDFGSSTGTNVDVSSSPGDVKLASLGGETADQVSSPAALSTTNNLSATVWTGQTFRAGVTGNLTKLTVGLGLASGTSGTITVEIRNLNGTSPGTTVLATSTLGPVTNVGTAALYTTTFATPAAVVSGTSYSIVLRSSVGNTVFGVRGSTAGGSTLANGQVFTTTNSGSTWTAVAADLYFTSYVTPPLVYQASGSISAIKDSGSLSGSSATWTTLSWTATTPTNTTVKFQAAGSNNAAGPFTLVGPDGTAATFFTTSGASLSQFNGFRYLKYSAILSTTDNTVTPVLNDVTVCETVVDCSPAVPTITPTQSPVCAGSTGNSASGPAGMTTYAWTIANGTITSATNAQSVTYTAATTGNVTLMLTVTTTNGCVAANSIDVPILNPTAPTITPGGPTTFCNGGSVTLNSSSASGNQWYLNGSPIGGATNQTYVATAAGDYTVGATATGCSTPQSAPVTVTIAADPATPTIAVSNVQTVTVTGVSGTFALNFNGQSTSSLAFNASAGSVQAQLNALASIGGVGGSTVVTQAGNVYTVTFGGTLTGPQPQLTATTAGGASVAVTAAAICGGSAGNQASGPAGATTYAWSITNGIITSANNIQTITYTPGASGNVVLNLTVTNAATCSAASAPANVPTNPSPATPTITPGGPTTFCTGGSVTLTSSSATGNQWYINGNPIGGATSQTYAAAASGDYTVQVTAGSCMSALSAATTVTVNAIPTTPTITPGGPTTFCTGGSVTLTSSSATGNQWYLNGNPIGGATNQTYAATASGNYSVIVTTSGCSSSASANTTVTVNPLPTTPTITPGGPTTFCTGGSVTLTSSSATGNQWYLNGNPIGGATNQTYSATASGNYSVIVTASGCSSSASANTTVTVNPLPPTPTITPGGPTTFCAGGNVTLTSSSATGNQWYLNGNPIGGATNQTYSATASGNYSVIVTTSGCSSSASANTTVTVNPIPSTPTITPGGPTTFCTGGSVTLTSSSATGNQWYLNGNPIGGATNQTYSANASGNYSVIVTTSGCSSSASANTTVTVNPIPSTPTITPGGPTTFCTGGNVTLTSSSASGNQWYLNGNPIGGATNQTYSANASGNYSVIVTASGCSSSASANTTVTVNPIPTTPTITPGGPTTFCAGGNVTLTSSSASGNQWYLNGNPIGGATNQTYSANASGNYSVIVTASGCSSSASANTTVTVNPIPTTPTITPGGPTTFCAGGNVTLTSSSATGNQWYLNGNPIGGATNQTYSANASGNYSVIVTTSGCSSSASANTTVTVNPLPPTPTITPGGPTTFCAGGSVTLTSSSATGNQWYLNGNPIGGATNQTYSATVAGDYSVAVTTSGCSSNASLVTTVTINPVPDATITVASTMVSGSSAAASVADAGVGATYSWSITGGSITAGAGTRSITFTAGGMGTLTLNATVTAGACSDTKPASVNVTAVAPTVTVTAVSPSNGSRLGGLSVTITGTGFQSGATVTFGGATASNVVVVNSTTITAKTPAHAAGAVNVTVTNADTSNATLNSGYTFLAQQFDANGDTVIDPADIFYLINYLFTSGPIPRGAAGMLSGDANGDSVVDPADIFYVVNYLFTGGPAPAALPTRVSADSLAATPFNGSINLGRPVLHGDHWTVPVFVKVAAGAVMPEAISLQLRLDDPSGATVRRAGAGAALQPLFEVSRRSDDALSYLVVLPGLRVGSDGALVAEVELPAGVASGSVIELDPALTMLSNASGTRSATARNGSLQLRGTTIPDDATKVRAHE